MKRLAALLAVLALGVLVIGVLGVAQQTHVFPKHHHPDTLCQYAVKVIQGGPGDPIGPGVYFTSVNIHNPWCHPVTYWIKLAVAYPNSREGPITGFQSYVLGPDGVTEYDLDGYAALLNSLVPPQPMPNFLEGYFVIESEEELDVVGVYTGSGLPDPKQQLATLELERVPARRVPRCRDIAACISTGVGNWQITNVVPAGPAGNSQLTVGPAPLASPECSAWVKPSDAGVECGAVWVGTSGDYIDPPYNTIFVSTAPGDYYYEFTFCLCCSFHDAALHLRVWADNTATVYLNDMLNPLASTINSDGFHSGDDITVSITSGFQVGTNTLRIVVHNEGNMSGLMVDGWLTAEAAQCP